MGGLGSIFGADGPGRRPRSRLAADDDPDVRAAAGDVLAIGRRASGAPERPWS
jgi:hypothetical protein